MSVTTNTLGPNSRQIVINNEQDASNIIGAINTALTALGWTLIDTVSSGSRDMIVKKVYSAPNNDSLTTPTTKYMILRFDTPKGLWHSSAAEYWDVNTHTATNETFHNNYAFPLSLQYSNNVIYIFASARYAVFATAVRSELGPWQGVFEFEREAAEDVAGQLVPCFGWTNALVFGEYYGSVYSTAAYGPRPHSFWVPRTINGYTGWGACQQFVLNTSFGMFPPPSSMVAYANPSAQQAATWYGGTTGHLGMIGGFGQTHSYAWDSGKKVISSVKLAGATTAMNTGRIYGLKVTPNFGAVLDTTTIPVDSNGFFQSTGTNAAHYLFQLSGGAYQNMTVASNGLTETTFNGGSNATVHHIMVWRGRFVYAATSAGIYKLDQDTAAWVQVLSTPTYYLAFDGKRTVYATAANAIIRLNLVDDTYDTLTVTGVGSGAAKIALDDTYLYVANAAAAPTPVLNIINLTSFAAERTYTSSWSLSSSYFVGLEADYQGNVFLRQVNSGGTSRVLRVAGATGIGGTSSDITSQDGYSVTGPAWIDFTTNRYYAMITANSYSTTTIVNMNSLNLDGNLYFGTNAGRANIGYHCHTITPFKGYKLFAGNTSAAVGLVVDKISDGNTTERMMAPSAGAIDLSMGGQSAYKHNMVTDGVFLFFGATMTTFSRIGGQAPGYNNSGTQTARVLFKA